MNIYKIWRSYYQKEQYNEFNILTNNNVIPFYTNDLSNNQININYLNEYLGELVMLYYVWKNNLKSDIIFIDQYAKRFYQNAYEDGIKLLNCNTNKNSVIVTWPYFDLELNHQWITNDIIVKYKTFLKQTYNMELEFPYNKFWWIMFGCKWETFCDICQFIFGFLDYLFPNESWKNINNLIDFRDNQYELSKTDNTINKDHRDMRFYKDKRFFAFLFEQLLPVYVSNKFNIIVYNHYNMKLNYCYEQNMNMNNLIIT